MGWRMCDAMTGTVQLFSKRAYGFIAGDDRISYFVHISQTGKLILRSSDRVRFDVGDDPRNPHKKQALNVVLINDEYSEKDNSNESNSQQ
jgi:cold shock CspA family protein